MNEERTFRRDRQSYTYREVCQRLAHGQKVVASDFETTIFVDDPQDHWQLERRPKTSIGARGCRSAWRHFFARHPGLRTRAVLAQAYDAQHGRTK